MKNKVIVSILLLFFVSAFSFAEEGNKFTEVLLDIVTNYGGTVEDNDFIVNAGIGYDFNREGDDSYYFPPVALSLEYTKQCGPCPLGFGLLVGYSGTGEINFYKDNQGYAGNFTQIRNNYLVTTTFLNYHLNVPVKWLDVYAGLQLGAKTNIRYENTSYKNRKNGQDVNNTSLEPQPSFHIGGDLGATWYFGKVIGLNVEFGYPMVFKGCLSIMI